MVKVMDFYPFFLPVDSMLGVFYRLFLWNFKKSGINHFLVRTAQKQNKEAFYEAITKGEAYKPGSANSTLFGAQIREKILCGNFRRERVNWF